VNPKQQGQKLMKALAADAEAKRAMAIGKDEAATKQAEPQAQTAPNAGHTCLCGCGSPTKGRFVPGHDARLKSRLINTVLDPKSHVEDRKDAEAELGTLGWADFLTKSRKAREAKSAAKAAKEAAK
jgi:hypothetical protein